MNVLGVHHQQMKKTRKNIGNKRCKEGIKVVYISSPMKVQTCASKFRHLVQELTGKDSNADAVVSRLSANIDIVSKDSSNDYKVIEDMELLRNDSISNDDSSLLNMNSLEKSPTVFSGWDMEPFDDDFMPSKEGSLSGIFAANSLFAHDFFHMDPLKSFS